MRDHHVSKKCARERLSQVREGNDHVKRTRREYSSDIMRVGGEGGERRGGAG